MKKLIGAAIVLLCLALATLGVLRIWGVSVISSYTLLRSGATLGVLAGALLVLIIVWFAFFPDPAAGYDAQRGNRAHPRQ
ncbi:hypothetical protein LRS06_10655 [Hymenobacter sp. J193]|uniref:hypothetical protein n=1 Tax=Hymenobacter sp. J193 TaxID=2898429 RepID=UPI002150FB74|nr:hypothetical protein [Hymenobacter sp. J193]MCR5888217.1 hypothetical protein [Hymenobacter sp. J193]